jgi:hypothetical protein
MAKTSCFDPLNHIPTITVLIHYIAVRTVARLEAFSAITMSYLAELANYTSSSVFNQRAPLPCARLARCDAGFQDLLF